MQQVADAGSLIKEKDSLINQLETKVQDLEEDKHLSKARCLKAIQYMYFIQVEIGILVAKVEMSDNHDLG